MLTVHGEDLTEVSLIGHAPDGIVVIDPGEDFVDKMVRTFPPLLSPLSLLEEEEAGAAKAQFSMQFERNG